MKTKQCLNCGQFYTPKKKSQKYCRGACRTKAYRKRHNVDEPDFLQKKKPRITGNNFPKKSAPVQSPKHPIVNAPKEIRLAWNELARQRAYLAAQYNKLNNGLEVGLSTIIGAKLVSDLSDGHWLGVLGGGYLGYHVGQKISGGDNVKHLKDNLSIKIASIDYQMQALLKSEQERQMIENLKTKKPKPRLTDITTTNKNKKVLSGEELAKLNIPKYNFHKRYQDFFGRPTKNFSAIVHGLPKSGKSTFCISFAGYLSEHQGKVLYIAAEEGHSGTIQDILRRTPQNTDRVNFADLRTFKEIDRELNSGSYRFVFIDSLSKAKIAPEQLEALRKKYKDVAFIGVLQSTKAGSFKGSQEYAHDVDIVVNVVDGIATQNGRFQAYSEMKVFDSPRPTGGKIRNIS